MMKQDRFIIQKEKYIFHNRDLKRGMKSITEWPYHLNGLQHSHILDQKKGYYIFPLYYVLKK